MQDIKRQFEVTTLQHYLLNARAFVKYLRDCPPDGCRLSDRACQQLITTMDGLIKSNSRNRTRRQHLVKSEKKERLHTPEDMRQCYEKSKAEVQELLGKSISHLANGQSFGHSICYNLHTVL